ncbi:MAG: glycosyltransferase family 4 protein, partial [Thermosphaera sp.]
SIIYNGVDFNYIDRAVNSKPKTRFYEVVLKAKEHGYKVLVYPARLHPIKNHSTLVKILWFLIKKYDPRILLVLTSDGISRQFIIRLAKRLGVAKNILITGKLPYDETLRILNLADAVPYVSLYEAMPLTLIEALYLNKFIVTFNFPYIREISAFFSSLPIRLVNSVKEFIEELSSILHNIATNNVRLLVKQFGVDSMVNSYIRLYERVSL